jgi:hypothetical protein
MAIHNEASQELITSFVKRYPSTHEEVYTSTNETALYSGLAKSRLGMPYLGQKDLSPSGSDHCDLLTRTAKTLLWGLIWFLSFDDDNDGELVWNFNVTKFIKSCFSATTLNPGHANPSQ